MKIVALLDLEMVGKGILQHQNQSGRNRAWIICREIEERRERRRRKRREKGKVKKGREKM